MGKMKWSNKKYATNPREEKDKEKQRIEQIENS